MTEKKQYTATIILASISIVFTLSSLVMMLTYNGGIGLLVNPATDKVYPLLQQITLNYAPAILPSVLYLIIFTIIIFISLSFMKGKFETNKTRDLSIKFLIWALSLFLMASIISLILGPLWTKMYPITEGMTAEGIGWLLLYLNYGITFIYHVLGGIALILLIIGFTKGKKIKKKKQTAWWIIGVIIALIIFGGYLLFKLIPSSENVALPSESINQDCKQTGTQWCYNVVGGGRGCFLSKDECEYDQAESKANAEWLLISDKLKDTTYCDNINFTNLQARCYLDLAKKLGNSLVCDKIDVSEDMNKDLCYGVLGGITKNVTICVKAQDKDYCYLEYARESLDKTACEKISDTDKRNECISSLSTNQENINLDSVDMFSSFKQVTCNGGDTLIRIFPGYTLSRLITKEIPNLLKFKSDGIIEDFYQVPLYEETMNKTFIENYYNIENPLMESGNSIEPLSYEKNYLFLIISNVETAKSSPLYEKMSQEGYTDYSFSTISIIPENYEESQVITYSCKVE